MGTIGMLKYLQKSLRVGLFVLFCGWGILVCPLVS